MPNWILRTEFPIQSDPFEAIDCIHARRANFFPLLGKYRERPTESLTEFLKLLACKPLSSRNGLSNDTETENEMQLLDVAPTMAALAHLLMKHWR